MHALQGQYKAAKCFPKHFQFAKQIFNNSSPPCIPRLHILQKKQFHQYTKSRITWKLFRLFEVSPNIHHDLFDVAFILLCFWYIFLLRRSDSIKNYSASYQNQNRCAVKRSGWINNCIQPSCFFEVNVKSPVSQITSSYSQFSVFVLYQHLSVHLNIIPSLASLLSPPLTDLTSHPPLLVWLSSHRSHPTSFKALANHAHLYVVFVRANRDCTLTSEGVPSRIVYVRVLRVPAIFFTWREEKVSPNGNAHPSRPGDEWSWEVLPTLAFHHSSACDRYCQNRSWQQSRYYFQRFVPSQDIRRVAWWIKSRICTWCHEGFIGMGR